MSFILFPSLQLWREGALWWFQEWWDDGVRPAATTLSDGRFLCLFDHYVGGVRHLAVYSRNNTYAALPRQAEQQRGLGPDHPAVATTPANLASLLRAAKRKSEAKKLEERARAVLAKNTAENSAQHTVDIRELGLRPRRKSKPAKTDRPVRAEPINEPSRPADVSRSARRCNNRTSPECAASDVLSAVETSQNPYRTSTGAG